MKNKVLFCATVDYHIQAFHLPYLKWFQEQGWEVHVAAKGNLELPFVDRKFNLPFERSPIKANNFKVLMKLRELIIENNYNIVHCHTPVGGLLGRLAANKSRKHGTKVLYTAHGFHFYKSAPLLNWLLFFPIEKILSKFTDVIITINEEDYKSALKLGFKPKNTHKVNGVGLDLEKFNVSNIGKKKHLREKNKINNNDFVLIYVAEINANKNQTMLINATKKLKSLIPNIKLLLVGVGSELERCKELAKRLDVTDQVLFLGYRQDVNELYTLADLAVASSYREGLPVNVMEAMAIGLPIIATDIRGHRDLISDKQNGYLVSCNDVDEMSKRIYALYSSKETYEKISKENMEKIKNYSLEKVVNQLSVIYKEHL